MSEERLRQLGRQAEDLVDLPDLATLQRRGSAMRLRRQVGVVAAAMLLAATGVWLVQDRTPATLEPAPPIEPGVGAPPYPGRLMQDLEPGTYELGPVDGRASVLVTVPAKWNSWVGPNRFNGHAKGLTNDEAFERHTWYVGLMVLWVHSVADETCVPPRSPALDVDSYRETVDAIRRLPGYRLVDGPTSGTTFGHRATHFTFRQGAEAAGCEDKYNLFGTESGILGGEERLDLWVVDVAGTTILVYAGESGNVPQRIRDELTRVVDSVEFVVPE